MEKLNRENSGLTQKKPIKIIQFGEGNFLRAFVEYAIQELNDKADFNAGIAVVQPIAYGMVNMLNEQDGLYTLFLKGIKKGEEIQEKQINSTIVKGINPYDNYKDYLNLAHEESLEFIISNTTESGIAYNPTDTLAQEPHVSFPAKLTALLYERFNFFKGDSSKGLAILPCELINYNGDTLKEIILKYAQEWKLDETFVTWIKNHNTFHNTLVDRIVPGYPKDEIEDYNKQLDFADNLIVTAETFFLWVIEGNEALKQKLPFHKTAIDVKIVDDMQPYRTRKVKILNGAHTAMVPFSLMYGNTTVKETVDNSFTGAIVREIMFNEINPTIDMDKDELNAFADEVLDRFRNPFIKHNLSSIALNSISKFKVRVLPSLLEYQIKFDKLPINLTFAFAALILFYKGNWKGQVLPVDDSKEIIDWFAKTWASNSHEQVAQATLQNVDFWEKDLTKVAELKDTIIAALDEIEAHGIAQAYTNFSQRATV